MRAQSNAAHVLRASTFKMVGVSVALGDVPKDMSAPGRRGRLALLAQGELQQHGDLHENRDVATEHRRGECAPARRSTPLHSSWLVFLSPWAT